MIAFSLELRMEIPAISTETGEFEMDRAFVQSSKAKLLSANHKELLLLLMPRAQSRMVLWGLCKRKLD